MKAKKFTIIVISSVLFIIILPALIIFIVDPIQLYHNQVTLKNTVYFKEQRHQNIGLINKFLKRGEGNYTIIVGTSMSENFVPSKLMVLLNDKHILKLAMSGGRPLEQYILLEKALSTGKVKRVIWDIHWYYLLDRLSKKDKNHDFPYKLYSNNIFNQAYYYLFNEDYLKDSIRVFLGLIDKKKWSENLNKLNYTMDDWIKKRKFERNSEKKHLVKLNKDIQKIKEDIPLLNIIEKKYSKNITYPNIESYFIPIIKKYKNVKFDVFFPPYSTYFYAKSKVKNSIRYIYARKYLVEKTKKLKNIKIYGFDNNYTIVNNIYYYKDYGHYRSEINDYIIKSILKNKHILNKNNINSYINKMIQNINNYNQIFYKDNTFNKLLLINKLCFKDLKYSTNGKMKILDNRMVFYTDNFKKYTYIKLKFSQVSNFSLLLIKMKYRKKDIKTFQITLKKDKEYAHFFIKPLKDNDDIIIIKNLISKKSKNFTFGFANEIIIKLYPNEKSYTNIEIKSIEFYTKKKVIK